MAKSRVMESKNSVIYTDGTSTERRVVYTVLKGAYKYITT